MKRIVACILLLAVAFALGGCTGYREGTVGFDKGDALVIAHRGLSGLEPENTEAAFIAAGKRSYWGIEADVRKTADGRFVMSHDATLERTAGVNVEVEATSFDELMQIPLLDRDGKPNKGLHLCELSDYISICKKYKKQAILELKSSFTEDELARMIELIRAEEYLDGVTFISFSYGNLETVRRLSPSQSAQYLFSDVTDVVIEQLSQDGIDASLKFTAATRENVEALHAAGLKVGCWTVDVPLVAEQMVSMGVDYITTNILE